MEKETVGQAIRRLKKRGQHNAIAKALGFKDDCEGQIQLKVDGYSHKIHFGDVEDVIGWLLEIGFDIVNNTQKSNL